MAASSFSLSNSTDNYSFGNDILHEGQSSDYVPGGENINYSNVFDI